MSRPVPLPAGPGQESVWDYPRPPAVEPSDELVEVALGGEVVARTRAALRVLETSHPPTYYLPRRRLRAGVLCPSGQHVLRVEGTGGVLRRRRRRVAELPAGVALPDTGAGVCRPGGHVAVMPGLVDACFVDGERVRPQEGGFYGGWITDRVVGPFKGGLGSWGW